MKEPTLCIVTWGDAWAMHGYYDPEGDNTPAVMQDVGWIAEENDETIVLYRSRAMEGSEGKRQVSVIPLCNVIKIEEVKWQ